MATLEDLEARVAALGANQREHTLYMDRLKTEVVEGFRTVDARFRSVDEQLAEIKDLIIGRRDSSS